MGKLGKRNRMRAGLNWDAYYESVIFQTLWTYDENGGMSSRHERHILAKQYTKTNPARDVKNRETTGRFPHVLMTL